MKSRSVPAAEFKNTCLKLIDDVFRHGVPITVTKRGKPVVRIMPVRKSPRAKGLVGTIVHQAADIFSTEESFEAER
jgi:prevent-host-death family protein